MKINNITLTKSLVKSFDEVNKEDCKYKVLRGPNNLREQISGGKLLKEGFSTLFEAYNTNKNQPDNLQFKGVENKVVIEELARFASLNPNFCLNSVMVEDTEDDCGNPFTRQTLAIYISMGKVDVTIL